MGLRNFLQDESGQGVIEYFLLLIVVVSISGMMKLGLKTITVRFWKFMGKKIAAPCDTCAASDDFNI